MKLRFLLTFLIASSVGYGQSVITNGNINQYEQRLGGIVSMRYFTLPQDTIVGGVTRWPFPAARQNGRLAYDQATGRPIFYISGWKTLSFQSDLLAYVKMSDTVTTIMTRSAANSAIGTMQGNINGKLNIVDTNVFARKISFTSGLASKFNNPTGTTLQYIRGDGSLSTFPTSTGTVTSIGLGSTTLAVTNTPITTSGTINVNLNTTGVTAGTYGLVTVDQYGRVTSGKRQQPYSGTTSGSGTYSVTFANAYSVAPNIQANIIGGTSKQFIVMTVSTTGFTVTAYQLNSVNLLSTDLLLSSTTALNGANIDVLITEK